MSIWGRRDSEPPAGETPQTESAAGTDQDPGPAGPEQQDEQAPAFWRAHGEAAPPGNGADSVPIEGTVVTVGAPGERAGEPAAVREPDTGEPAITHEPGAGEPAIQEPPEPMAAAVAPPAPATPATAPAPAAEDGISAQRWNEIMATFVDDPRGSVKQAADTVDAAIDEFVTAVRARQQALTSSWDAAETGTEELRVALRDYRTLWYQVRRLDLPGENG